MTAPVIRQSATHSVKASPIRFADIATRRCTFILHPGDVDFQVGDYLRLREWSVEFAYTKHRECVRVITYIVSGHAAMAPGWLVLGFS